MQITALEVENFRAVSRAVLSNLPAVIVIAGPNGCGKSCLFDAIRLFKSAYGGYAANEWQSWFGEFQINLDPDRLELRDIFRDRTKSVRVRLAVSLRSEEKTFLDQNAEGLLQPMIWEKVSGGTDKRGRRQLPAASQVREHRDEVDELTASEAQELRTDLLANEYAGELIIEPDLSINTTRSPSLELAFSLFRPDRLGIIDYHSAQRGYSREQVSNVNLNIDSSEQQYKQHALYNFAQKYQNIKTQMASGYIRELLMKAAGEAAPEGESLIDTLKEMFRLFFPEKEFLGAMPTADGRLMFPVRTKSGLMHDINDLSSGEKEVLYGYLRLRNVAPKNSVLLLDEPELHLNPRLIRGLPQFYHRHVGKAMGNQLGVTGIPRQVG